MRRAIRCLARRAAYPCGPQRLRAIRAVVKPHALFITEKDRFNRDLLAFVAR